MPETETPMMQYVEEDFIQDWIIDDVYPPNRSRTGYGPMIPTQYRIKCTDKKIRRVYAICYSNVSSHYILVDDVKTFIHSWFFPESQ